MAIQLTATKHKRPPRIVLHGGPKVGKSTFASQIPGVVFLPTEEGLRGIEAQALINPELGSDRYESLEAFLQGLEYLEQNVNQFQAACIDTLDWLETLIHDYVCRSHNVQNIVKAAGGYGAGYVEALNIWNTIIQRLDRLNHRGLIIICVCHSKSIPFNDPEAEASYDVWEIKLHASAKGQGALTLFREWADVIGFATVEKFVNKSKNTDKNYRASFTGRRILHLEGTDGFLAGNRYSLPTPIELTWPAFMEAMSNPKQ